MKITIDYYVDDGSAWDAFIATLDSSTNYHKHDWRYVIEKSFGHKTFYLYARNSNDEICGVLPLAHIKSKLFGSFLVSLPFFNYGGLLCNDDDTASALLDELTRVLKKVNADYAELRHLNIRRNELVSKEHKVTMTLSLQDTAELQWHNLDAKVRNQVRKAEKCGLTAVLGHMELLDGFYEVFSRNMRDLGTPVYGKSFFKNILEIFPDSTRIISVMLKDKTIASGILTWFRDTLEVPWASSISDYREMCPNNLLYWEAIQYAIVNGFKKFDFGRSTPGEGTYNFKKQWGAKPIQLFWQYQFNGSNRMPELNTKNPKYKMAIKIWKKLPLAVTIYLGPGIVKNIP